MADEIPLSPVTSFAVMAIPAYGAVVIRLDFLTHSMQAASEAHPGPHCVMYPAAARKLAEQILEALAQLESAPPPGAGLPKH